MNHQILRFPCGHLEAQPSVTARMREASRAAWVGCRRCNVIALTITPAPAAVPRSRPAGKAPTG